MDERKERKSGGAIRFVIPAAVGIALTLMLLAVAALTGYFEKKENPEEILEKAVEETFTRSEDAIREIWRIDEYADMFGDGQVHIDGDIDLSGLGSLSIQYDMVQEYISLRIGMGYYGISVFTANLYMDKEGIRFGVPGWLDDVLYIDLTTISEDIETFIKSIDADEAYADELRQTCRQMQELMELGEDDKYKESQIEAFEQLEDALHDMCAREKITRAGNKQLIVNGRERDCEGYIVTISDTAASEFFLNFNEIYADNRAFQNYFDRMLASIGGSDLDYDTLQEAFDVFSDACFEMGDIQVYCYLYDGVLAQISFESGEMSFEWNICGGSFPLENMDLTFAYDSEAFAIQRSGSLDGDDYEAEYRILADGEELVFTAEYNRENGEFCFLFEDEWDSSLLVKGQIEISVPGSEFAIIIDTLKADGEEILYGDITVSNECEKIEVPEGRLRNVLTMTEDEWYEIFRELYEYLY